MSKDNLRSIPFSPPDISELEVVEVIEALRSGWITTGPRTKLLERRLAAYIETGRNDIDCTAREAIEKYTNRVVCLNSATAVFSAATVSSSSLPEEAISVSTEVL